MKDKQLDRELEGLLTHFQTGCYRNSEAYRAVQGAITAIDGLETALDESRAECRGLREQMQRRAESANRTIAQLEAMNKSLSDPLVRAKAVQPLPPMVLTVDETNESLEACRDEDTPDRG